MSAGVSLAFRQQRFKVGFGILRGASVGAKTVNGPGLQGVYQPAAFNAVARVCIARGHRRVDDIGGELRGAALAKADPQLLASQSSSKSFQMGFENAVTTGCDVTRLADFAASFSRCERNN